MRPIMTMIFVFIILTPNFESSQILSTWDCLRPWPELELFLPVTFRTKRHDDWRALFLRSLYIFWPLRISRVKLRFLIDEEEKKRTRLAETFPMVMETSTRIPGGVSFSYNPPSPYYNEKGWYRQQLLSFYADNYTSSKFVGFVDSDCIFTTYVDREDLFFHGKPIINARDGHAEEFSWMLTPGVTFSILDILEPMICSSFFPVIIETIHLKELRDYIEKRFQKPFYLVFQENMVGRFSSHFNIICTYLFTYRRESYNWHIYDTTPWWDGVNPQPAPGQSGNKNLIPESYRIPRPHISDHARYRIKSLSGTEDSRANVREVLQRGLCLTPPFPNEYCKFVDVLNTSLFLDDNTTDGVSPPTYTKVPALDTIDSFASWSAALLIDFFRFEALSYSKTLNESILLREHKKRLQRIHHCHHVPSNEEIAFVLPPSLQERAVVSCLACGTTSYVVENNTLLRIPDPYTALKLGYNLSSKINFHPGEFRLLPRGAAEVLPRYPIEEGNVITCDDVIGEYYMVNGSLRRIPDTATRMRLNAPWYHSRKVDVEAFNEMQIGPPLQKLFYTPKASDVAAFQRTESRPKAGNVGKKTSSSNNKVTSLKSSAGHKKSGDSHLAGLEKKKSVVEENDAITTSSTSGSSTRSRSKKSKGDKPTTHTHIRTQSKNQIEDHTKSRIASDLSYNDHSDTSALSPTPSPTLTESPTVSFAPTLNETAEALAAATAFAQREAEQVMIEGSSLSHRPKISFAAVPAV